MPIEYQDMVNHINNSRYAIGLQQLHYDGRLRNAAFYHAKDMAERNYFSHWTPEGWSVTTRLEGWSWPSWMSHGEVIACGSGSAWDAFQQWMNSPGHRAQLHNGYYNAIGVAHYHTWWAGCNGHHWVVVVGRR